MKTHNQIRPIRNTLHRLALTGSTARIACSLATFALAGSSAHAAVIGQLGILQSTANGGINPATGVAWAAGDTYRLVFVTSTATLATSTDIATYNAFVQGLANAAGLGSVTWKVVGSTATVDARDNTNTNPNVDGDGVPTIRMDGNFVIANDYNQLWQGINNTQAANDQPFLSIHLDENGVERLDDRMRTGSNGNGTASTDSDRVLGGSAEATPRVTTGRNYAPDFYGSLGGTSWMQDWSEDADSSGRVFAMSEILTVIPEPSSVALLGLSSLALLRRRR